VTAKIDFEGSDSLERKHVDERGFPAIQEAIKGRRAPQVQTDGIASKTLPVALPRSALVRRFEVTVRADHADAASFANVAQVRAQPAAIDGLVTLIVDFGMPRTVAAIGASNEEIQIFQIRPWTGAAFADAPVYTAANAKSLLDGTTVVTGAAPSRSDYAVFPSEVRTERLMIDLFTDQTDVVALSQDLWAQLPDAPADLELRIDQGPPVFRWPGPVQGGRDGWDADARRTVDLTAAFDALTHDPVAADTNLTFQVTLTSRVPGLLGLTTNEATKRVSYLQRIVLGAEGKRDLAFDAEGQQTLTLPLRSSTAAIEAVSLLVSGNVPPERAVPPLGPPIATTLGGASESQGVAELRLDPDHSVCVRPLLGGDLGELVAVRLPLRADPGGAEVRVLLLGNAEAASGGDPEPGPPTGGSSKSVTLDGPDEDAGTDGADTWLTFAFPRATPLKSGDPLPWVQVVVLRGAVRWTLGQFGTEPPNPLRRGPTAGPWSRLPRLLGEEAGIGGRVRLVGRARKDKPIAPLSFSVVGPTRAVRDVGATPTAKGALVSIEAVAGQAIAPRVASGNKTVDLVVVSSVAATVAIRDVDVTGSK